ncbi:MAG TPA: hypothetical protein PK609_03245 [Candidatus Paceibacterota bacterium]|nr:hypothetical protein [Candidatus Paceibacterota bacterium]
MNRILIILFCIALIAIGAGAAWYLVDSHNDAMARRGVTATTTQPLTEGVAIYTNGTYGFSVFYPQSAEVSYAFDTSYHLGSAWRANALPEILGTPIVAIIPYKVSNETAYPRYFNAMVRVGASNDPQELERCEEAATDQGETALGEVEINGTTWSTFSFESAGMMQYASGISYRTVHEGQCIALEKVRTGSTYREMPQSEDIADDVLMTEYQNLDAIVESFTFAR